MSEYGRRLIVDYPFDRALWSVIDAFIREGFTVKATDIRGLVQRGRDLRKYVLLEAVHPGVTREALRLDLDVGVLLPCQIAVYELAGGRTVVTAADPMASVACFASWRKEHPALAGVAQNLEDRVARALHVVSRRGSLRGRCVKPSAGGLHRARRNQGRTLGSSDEEWPEDPDSRLGARSWIVSGDGHDAVAASCTVPSSAALPGRCRSFRGLT